MGILSVRRDLLSNSKSQLLKYLFSSSNFRFVRRISSPAIHDPAGLSKAQSPHDPSLVGDDLKSNNNNKLVTMLLTEHFHNGSGNYKHEYYWERRFRHPPYNYSLISAAAGESWKYHQDLCNNPFSGLGKYVLAGSCNELMLLFFSVKNMSHFNKMCLWNPAINEIIKILPESDVPEPPPVPASSTTTIAHGFGFDPESEDYKVLRFIVFNYEDGSDTYSELPHVELYSLKTNSWKKIINTDPRFRVPYQEPSVHVNGVYYWASTYSKPATILSFDFANEKFSSILLPPEFDEHNKGKRFRRVFDFIAYRYVLVEFDGSLAALVHSELKNTDEEEKPFSFEVWGWNGESWHQKVSRIAIDHVPGGGVIKVVGLFQNEKLFLHSGDGELMLFDLAQGKLENLGIRADPFHVQIFPYASAVPHN